MGNFSLYGILLIVGLFFTLSGLLLTQINVTDPYTGESASIFSMILGWIIP